MEIVTADEKTCTQCGICVEECPGLLIELKPYGFPGPIATTETACLRCGHCVAVCPTGSLIHRDMPASELVGVKENLRVTAGQCEQMLKSRRSVRVFKKQPLSREIITRLIEISRFAPTGHNNQELEWLVIDKREDLDHIERLGLDWIQWAMKNMPQMAAMFNMEEMLVRQQRDNNVFMRGAPALIVTHAAKNNPMALIDSATALSYLDLAANAMGLGTCWAGFIYIMATTFLPVTAALALPEGHTAYGAMMLGYNKFKYPRIPTRKAPKIMWR